jgi:hypothetical protein
MVSGQIISGLLTSSGNNFREALISNEPEKLQEN